MIKKNNLLNKNFTETKSQWKQEAKNSSFSFFIDAELLISEQDIILLQVKDENELNI